MTHQVIWSRTYLYRPSQKEETCIFLNESYFVDGYRIYYEQECRITQENFQGNLNGNTQGLI